MGLTVQEVHLWMILTSVVRVMIVAGLMLTGRILSSSVLKFQFVLFRKYGKLGKDAAMRNAVMDFDFKIVHPGHENNDKYPSIE